MAHERPGPIPLRRRFRRAQEGARARRCRCWRVADHPAEVRSAADEAAFLRGIAEGRRQAEADETARLAGAMQRLTLHLRRGGRPSSATVAHSGRAAGGGPCRDHGQEARGRARRARTRWPRSRPSRRSVFGHLRAAPHVVVRVRGESRRRGEGARSSRIARGSGFRRRRDRARRARHARSAMRRIEWADGGAVRDSAALERVSTRSCAGMSTPRAEEEKRS